MRLAGECWPETLQESPQGLGAGPPAEELAPVEEEPADLVVLAEEVRRSSQKRRPTRSSSRSGCQHALRQSKTSPEIPTAPPNASKTMPSLAVSFFVSATAASRLFPTSKK